MCVHMCMICVQESAEPRECFGSPGTSVLDIGPTKPRSSVRQLAFLTAEPSSLKLRSCFSMGA